MLAFLTPNGRNGEDSDSNDSFRRNMTLGMSPTEKYDDVIAQTNRKNYTTARVLKI